ncbi:AEC family transporter [Litorivicinus sp.]|nr:AEC family transporter [Litorivicinus sp.]MDC1240674.1 AEC family transporter [Litorivicinus sp.]
MFNEIIIERILGSVIPVLIIVLIGYAYGRWRSPNMTTVNQINMELFLPILIFSVLAAKSVDLSDYTPLAIGAVVVILGSGILTAFFCKVTGLNIKTLVPPMMFTNTGNLALPLVLLAFGEAAMPAIIVIFVVSQFLHFTLGFYILDRHARVLNRISVPTIIATLAGIGVGMTDVHIPALVMIPMEMLAQIGIPMVLFALGIRMQDVTTNDLRVGITAAILCPVTGLALAYCLQPILQLDALQWSVFLVFAALPPAVLNYMVAERYNQEPSRVASIVLIGNIGAIVWMPLALALAPTF